MVDIIANTHAARAESRTKEARETLGRKARRIAYRRDFAESSIEASRFLPGSICGASLTTSSDCNTKSISSRHCVHEATCRATFESKGTRLASRHSACSKSSASMGCSRFNIYLSLDVVIGPKGLDVFSKFGEQWPQGPLGAHDAGLGCAYGYVCNF